MWFTPTRWTLQHRNELFIGLLKCLWGSTFSLRAVILQLNLTSALDSFSLCEGVMVTPATSSKPTEVPDKMETETETDSKRKHSLKHFPTYGTMNGNPAGDTCPTCRGTGRIPRGFLSLCLKLYFFTDSSERVVWLLSFLFAACSWARHISLSHHFVVKPTLFKNVSSGDKDRLVAVIPCNDVRLKPRRT